MPSDPAPLEILPLIGIPEVRPGDDLAGLLAAAATGSRIGLHDGDVLVVSSKVVSKALGLRSPDEDRESVVRQESRYVVAERRAGEVTTRIVRASAGPVMAAAGVDASNTGGDPVVLRLPHDPDGVCRDLRERLRTRHDAGRIGVVLTDTAGRPWRIGQTDFALGAAGLRCVDDLRGRVDADGRPLHVTSRAVADELAAAADLVKGKTARCPAVVVRGLAHLVEDDDGPGATALLRVGDGDWFGYGAAEAVRASLGVEPGSPAAQVVGVAATGPEPLPDRVARAVAVALHGVGDAGCDVLPPRARTDPSLVVTVTAPDSFTLGAVTARLVAALWGEALSGRVRRHTPDVGQASATVEAGPLPPRETRPDRRRRIG